MFQSCHVRVQLVQWECAQMCTSLSGVHSAARTPWAFRRCCQRLGWTPITTFLSRLLLVHVRRFQAGSEGAGWQSSPGERWWYKPARTAAPTSHQVAASAASSSEGCLDQPPSRARAAFVQQWQLSHQGQPGPGYCSNSSSSAHLFTLSEGEVGGGTTARWRGGGRSCWEAGGRALGDGTRSAGQPWTSPTFLPEGEVGLWNVEHSTHRDKMEEARPWCQVFTQLICKELPGFSEAVKTSWRNMRLLWLHLHQRCEISMQVGLALVQTRWHKIETPTDSIAEGQRGERSHLLCGLTTWVCSWQVTW